MKRYILIISCLLVHVLGYGQDDGKPDVLLQTLTGTSNTNYSTITLTPKGVFKTARVQANATQSPSYWLFHDAPSDFNPKWARTSTGAITVNQFNDDYASFITDFSGVDGEVNITAGKYYTFNIQDVAADADLAILETDFLPQSIDSVYQTPHVDSVYTYQSVTVTIITGGALNAGEKLWLRYTKDSWATSTFVAATLTSGNDTYEAVIPAQNSIENMEYYVLTTLSSNTSPQHNTIDFLTLEMRPEIVGNNYTYTTKYPASSAGAPVIDGVFDGTTVWGSAIATADGNDGWSAANAKKLYATFDDYYYYFGAEVSASDWMDWGFVINTKTGGSSSEPWSRSITYDHADLPDYVIKGHFGDPNDNGSNTPFAQLISWNGSTWEYVEHTSFIGEDETVFVETKVLKSEIGTPGIVDVQFYITGNNNDHGTFDACPDDANANSWNMSSAFTVLDNYQSSVALPVELASFVGKVEEDIIQLSWTTLSEANNAGFEIEKSINGHDFVNIGSVEGTGNSLRVTTYAFVDDHPNNGTNYYRLKQVDFDGAFEYSTVIAVDFWKESPLELYPNPVRDQLFITTGIQDDVTIRVIATSGKVITEKTLYVDNQFSFDVSQLNNGTYFLQIIHQDSAVFNKVFVKE